MRTITRDWIPWLALSLAAGLAATPAHAGPPPLIDPGSDESDTDADNDGHGDGGDGDGEDADEATPPQRSAPAAQQHVTQPFLQPSAVPHAVSTPTPTLRLASTSGAAAARSATPSATTVVRRPTGAGDPEDDALDFDPYARRPVRAYLGASGGGTFLLGQSITGQYINHGGGFNIYGGFDLGHIFGIEVRYGGSFHGAAPQCNPGHFTAVCDATYLVLQTLSLDARLRMPTGTRVTPFLQAGGTLAWMGREGFFVESTGAGGEGGGGIEIWVNDSFTIDFRALYRGLKLGDFNHVPGTATFNDMLFTEMGFAFRL